VRGSGSLVTARLVSLPASGPASGGERTRPVSAVSSRAPRSGRPLACQLHPEVAPQVLHFMQVPLRTRV
jgi:hypothetical protein